MATGLDYAGVESYLRLQGFEAEKSANIFRGIRIMERSALEAMHKRSGKKDG